MADTLATFFIYASWPFMLASLTFQGRRFPGAAVCAAGTCFLAAGAYAAVPKIAMALWFAFWGICWTGIARIDYAAHAKAHQR